MKLHFVKMEGAGNDYVYFDCFTQQVDAPERLAPAVADRHFGVGGDGIVLICPSDIADAGMRMFNLDGSEGKMCGNAIRCVGKYLYDSGRAVKETVTVETLSGVKTLSLTIRDGKAAAVSVEMGRAVMTPQEIPVRLAEERVVGLPVEIGGVQYHITCVSMGNPHCVVFVDSVRELALPVIGPSFEHSPLFPEGVNTEFVQVVDSRTLEMRVWERGSGETLACGTGACAAAVAAVENGFCPRGEEILVRLSGGELVIRYTDEGVTMTGPARRVFEGDWETEEMPQ